MSSFAIHFRDARPPHEIQFELEGKLRTLLRPGRDEGKLALRGALQVTGYAYSLQLRFDAALAAENCYSLRIDASSESVPAGHREYFLRSFDGWVQYWTQPYRQAPEPHPGEGCLERYRLIEQQTLAEGAGFADAAAVQREILARMRDGASFSTADKEGGTNIRWVGHRFIRADFGESEATTAYPDDEAFLGSLRQVYRSATGNLAELDAWTLILRFMNR